METSTIRTGSRTYTKNFLNPKMATKEFEVLSFLFENGISIPQPIKLDKDRTCFSMELIEGDKIKRENSEIDPILEIMVKYQSLNVPNKLKVALPSYLDEGKLYAQKLGLNGNFKKMYQRMYDLSDCLVQNDLIDKNLIKADYNFYKIKNLGFLGKIYFIDWGSAIYGMPQTDLVRVITTFGKLDTQDEEIIKQKYNQLNPTQNFEEKYALAKDFQDIKLVAKTIDFAVSSESKKEVQENIERIKENLK